MSGTIFSNVNNIEYNGNDSRGPDKSLNVHVLYLTGVKHVKQMTSPRMVKCHLPYSMLPQQLREGKGRVCCVIYGFIATFSKQLLYLHFYELTNTFSTLSSQYYKKF